MIKGLRTQSDGKQVLEGEVDLVYISVEPGTPTNLRVSETKVRVGSIKDRHTRTCSESEKTLSQKSRDFTRFIVSQ